MNMPKKLGTKHLVGFAVTLLCLILIARQINLDEVLQALRAFEWPYLALGVVSLSFGYVLRIFRWSLMLQASGASTRWRHCSAPFLGSIALNNVLPLRLGDVVRALVFPLAIGVSRTTATSSLLMERLIDLLTLLVCLLIGVMATQGTHIPPIIMKSAAALAVGGISIMILGLLFSGRLSRLFHRLAHTEAGVAREERIYRSLVIMSQLLDSFEAMSRPKILLAVMMVSMLVWVGESGLFYFLLLGFGLNANPALAVIVMAIATLSTLVPSAPGYIGPFHLAAFTAITMLGGTSAQAGSYAVLTHLALWLPTTIVGAIAIWMSPALFHGIRTASNKT